VITLCLLFISDGGEELQKVSINCSFLVDGLLAFTNYTFYVRAYSLKSASDQSKRTTCQTGEGGKFSAKTNTRMAIISDDTLDVVDQHWFFFQLHHFENQICFHVVV
jgi:hypothetical protein